ncbi:MAG: amino acid permease [Henriciella sp.]|nr:amino acid permease [Henriciella sp.]MBO6696498.1 amino acid permease [Henriciella sp.]
MVGTGVFTSLGFQLATLQSGFALIMLWVVGGVIAVCGALSYAELGAALPRSGGEYNFFGRIYHPSAGFVSGWVSSTIGFSAPVALAAMTFGAYTTSSILPDASETVRAWVERGLAVGLIISLTLVHTRKRQTSGAFQTLFTAIKVAVILVISAAGLALVAEYQPVSLLPRTGDAAALTSSAFAVSLIYVSYAYTGWNVATYLTDELEQPQRSLPRVLFAGAFGVMLLYILLNAVFLLTTPMEKMVGEVEVGVIAARHVFGQTGALFTGVVLGVLLISTVSAMTIAGPRVLQMIGQDIKAFRFLAKTNSDGMPTTGVLVQSGLALIFVLTATFDQVLVFAGFTLALNSLLAVGGLFVLRIREPNLERPFKVPLFPVLPIIYLVLTIWTLVYVAIERPQEVAVSAVLIAVGIAIYLLSRDRGAPTS